MSYVVSIVSCHGIELQRKAARTEPEWTFTNLYSSLSISDEYDVIDIKSSSNGKMEWVSVELLQPTEIQVCNFSEKSCPVQSGRVWSNLISAKRV